MLAIILEDGNGQCPVAVVWGKLSSVVNMTVGVCVCVCVYVTSRVFVFIHVGTARVCLRVYFISVHFAWFNATAGVGDRVCVRLCVCVRVLPCVRGAAETGREKQGE